VERRQRCPTQIQPSQSSSLVAVVELEDGWASGDQLEAERDARCRAALASLKCPNCYEFRQPLPRTASGKLLRRVIRQEMSEEVNGPVQH
jgi:long-chain acyl-CoA synthetase